jgi:hypothetical protein
MFFSRRNEAPLVKIPARTAAEICKECELDPATESLLVPAQTPAEFLQALEKNQFAGEAVKFLAHALPEREAVWWLCQSSRVVEAGLNTAETQALLAAEKWVKDPSSANRTAAGEAAEKTDMSGPGGWAAQAAAWSRQPAAAKPGAPPDPTAGLTVPAVAGGILLAAGLVGKPRMPEIQAPNLSMPAFSPPQVSPPAVAMPAAPGLNVPQPAIPGVTLPQLTTPGMPTPPGAPAVPALQAPGVNLPTPAIPGLPSPPGITAPQVPGAPQIQAPQINISAPATPGMPSAPAIAAPEIPPLDQKKLAKMLKAFLELGREVAAGKNTWA